MNLYVMTPIILHAIIPTYSKTFHNQENVCLTEKYLSACIFIRQDADTHKLRIDYFNF